MPDPDGYPTPEELDQIKHWSMLPDPDSRFKELMTYIQSLWTYPDCFEYQADSQTYTLITLGWSGNEDLISALQQNGVFWAFYWESSERGGKHVFSPIHTSRHA